MSTVNITSASDAEARIRNSAVGDTITFAGDLLLPAMRNLPGERAYKSLLGSRIRGVYGDYATFGFNNVKNLDLDLVLEDANVNVKFSQNVNIRVDSRNMKARPGPESRHCVFVQNINGGTVTGTFRDMLGADTCIFGYDTFNVKFNSGRFYNVHEGIHVSWFHFDPNIPHDNYFDANTIEGIRRHGIELQGGPNGCFVRRNHISKRLANGINLSIATGGDFNGPITYDHTARIEVDDNVLDNTGFAIPDPSQCMGIEIMGRFKCRRNIIVNGGQGIAYTYNPTDAIISDNKFKATAKPIVTDPPHDQAKAYVGFSTNDLNYTGVVPNAAETTGGTPPPPPPPPPPPDPNPMPTFSLTAVAKSDTEVQFVWSGLPLSAAQVKLASITTTGREFGPSFTRLASPTNFLGSGFSKNWNYDFSATAVDANGALVATSNQVINVKVIAPATPPPPPPPPPPLSFVSVAQNIKRSDGTTVPYDVPFENGQPNYAKATAK